MICTISVGIIAYNEHRYLPDLLGDLLYQTYDKKRTEIILVDGESDDDTWNIMEIFRDKYISEYYDIKLYKNPKRIQPAGWNIVINEYKMDALLRIDAHARLTKDFIEKNVSCINAGEFVCGGPRENIIDGSNPWKMMLLDAEKSMFGAGIAPYRNKTNKKKYVKTLFHGCYTRNVIESVGMFDERLIRTEDNEYHYRIRDKGYNICYDPNIISFYQTRNTLRDMLRQKYSNGLWIGRTLFYCPRCISFFHLIPAIFVVLCLFSVILFCLGFKIMLIGISFFYLAFLLSSTVVSIIRNKNWMDILLPTIIFQIHIAYGVGTLIGITIGKGYGQS